jgi:hypothetical protein
MAHKDTLLFDLSNWTDKQILDAHSDICPICGNTSIAVHDVIQRRKECTNADCNFAWDRIKIAQEFDNREGLKLLNSWSDKDFDPMSDLQAAKIARFQRAYSRPRNPVSLENLIKGFTDPVCDKETIGDLIEFLWLDIYKDGALISRESEAFKLLISGKKYFRPTVGENGDWVLSFESEAQFDLQELFG